MNCNLKPCDQIFIHLSGSGAANLPGATLTIYALQKNHKILERLQSGV